MFQTRRMPSSRPLSSRQRKLSEYLQSNQSSKKFHIPNPFTFFSHIFTSASARILGIFSTNGRIVLYILLSIIVSIILFFGYSFFTIQKIYVTNDVTSQVHLNNTDKFIGKSIIFSSDQAIQDALLKNNPEISLITVKRTFPQSLYINVHLAHPVLSIKVNDLQYILLDADGKVVKIVFEPIADLPTLTYYQKLVSTDYEIGTHMSYSDIRASAQIASVLARYGYADYSIQIDDTARIDVNWKGVHLILSNKSDISRQINSMDEFMRVLTRSTEKYKKVDFRFDRAITEK
ncbi:MAG: hypothetical protein WCO78_00255 [Candidatus Roizmanbacteria bacterium]